jgi:phage gp29-like protein
MMPEEKKRTRKKAAAPKPDTRPAIMPSGTTPDSYWSIGLEQYNPDAVVKANGLKIYREMVRRDPVIALGLQYLETARLAKGWSIDAGEGERAEEIAEFARYVLANIEGTERDLLHDLLDALPMGYAVVEKVPEVYEDGPYAGKWGYQRFASKWQESIDLVVDEYGDLVGLKYKGQLNGKYGAVIEGDDLARFVVFVPNRAKGNWYGESVLRPIYRVYTIKDHLSRYLAVHMEKFGSGVYELGTSALAGDRSTILDGLKAMHGSSCIVHGIDENFVIHYPPPGVGDGLVSAIEYCNSEMLRGLSIPQTLFAGTGSGGAGGSLALSETHERTFGETVDRVGRSLEDCMDEQVLRPLVEWNWPSVQVEEMPHFRFEPYQAEDGMAALERLEKAKGLGASLMIDAVYEAAGAERPPEDAPEEDVIGGKSASAPEIGEPMEPGKIPPQLAPFVGKRPVGQGPEDGTGFPFGEGRTTFEEAVREVNEFERKVNFGEIRAKTDGMIAAYLDEATKLANEIRQTAVEVVDEKLGKGGAE